MNLLIVRHAESTANREERWQGLTDYRLSRTGRLQANRLRSRLERERYRPTHIYSSPLSRALDTAQIVASNWDRPIEAWEELTEFNVGVIAGLTRAEVEEKFPEAAKSIAANHVFDRVEGAETHNATSDRAQCVVDRLICEHDNSDRVMVFTHGGVLAHIIRRLLGTDRLRGVSIRNTAIFEFSIDVSRWHLEDRVRNNQGLWRIVQFNDAHHLD